MFELNGERFTIAQIENAAQQSNMSMEEYLKKSGMTRIPDSSLDFQSPTMPGAVVGENQAPDTESKSVDPSGVILVPLINGMKIPITYGGESVDDLTGDEIFQRVIDNTKPILRKQWEGLKAAATNWSKNVIGEDFTDLVTKGDQGSILYIDPKTNKKISYKDNPEKWVELNSEKAFNFDSSIKSVYADTGEEVGKATEKYMIDTFKKIDEESNKIQYAGSLVKGVAGVDGPSGKEFFGGALSTVQSLVTSMVPALLTRGATITPQITGSMYGDYNIEKARTIYGDDPNALDKLVENNEAEFTIPVALGFAAAAGEYVGMKGVGRVIAKSGLKSKNAILHLWAAGGEGTTEWYQTGVEGYSTAIAQGKNAIEAAGDAWDLMTSPQGIEAFVQGAFGSGMITTSSAAIKNAYISARDNNEGLGIVPKGMRDLATLKQRALETTDPDVRAGIENSILDLQNKIENSVAEGNNIVDNASEQEVAVLADAQVALKLYETQASTLVSKLEAGTITQEQHDLALTGYVNEYTKSQEAARDTIGEISNKNEQASKNNEELLGIIKNPESTEQQIATAKNRLVENNQGLINNIVNKNFNPTLDTTLTKEDFASEINIEFAKLINSYKPESGTPFGAYVAQNLPRRLPAIFDKLVETKTNEEGKQEIISKQDITEKQIEGEITTQKEVKLETAKTKSVKNKLFTSKLGFDKKFVPGQTDKTFADVFSEAVTKTFGTSLPEITDKNFIKEFQKKNRAELTPIIQNLLKKDKDTGVDNFKIFLEQNFDAVINQLPQSVINKKYKMLREAVLNEEGKQQREGTKEGKGIFKRVEQEKSDFIDYFTDPKVGSSTRSDRKQSLLRTLVDELSADAATQVVNDKSVMDKFKKVQELEGKEVPSDLEGTILKAINRIDSYLEKRANDKSLRVEIIPGLTVMHNLFDAFVKQVRNGLEQGLTFAKAVDNALTLASKYFHDSKAFEAFKTATKVLTEQNIGDTKVLKELLKKWNIITIQDLQKYGFETSFVNHLTFQLKEAGTLENQQAMLKIILLAEARSIKNIPSGEITTNQQLANKLKSILKKINPKLATKKEGVGVELKVNKKGKPILKNGKKQYDLTVAGEVVSVADPKDTFKKSIKEGNFSESIEISKTSRIYFENLMQHYIDTGNIKDGIAHLKLLAINQRGLLRKLAKPNLYVSLDHKMDDTTLEHDPPVDAFFEAAIEVLQNPKKWDKFKSNILDNYHINLIPTKIDDILTKNGMKKSLPEGANIFDDPNARMKTPEVEKALKKDKGILDLKNELNKEKGKILEKEFNQILEETKNLSTEERVSEAAARVQGKKAEKIRMFVPFTAEDLKGLLYRWAGKGKQGNKHLKWIKENITDVLNEALILYDAAKVKATEKLTAAKQAIRDAGIDLGKEAILGYSNDQAIRIFMWHRKKINIPGVPEAEAKKVYMHVRNNLNFLQYAEQIENIFEEGEFPAPIDKGWTASTITKDFLTHFNSTTRQKYLKPFFDNMNSVLGEFDTNTGKLSGDGTNKLRKLFGNTYILALENMLYRIHTGRNRSYQLDQQGNRVIEWWNQAIGNIMFLNTRSATLQQISFTNFINWTDNNPLKVAAAFSNLPQFINDLVMIFNSSYLKQRRAGLKTDINFQEIADAAELSQNKIRAIISAILKKGFVLTQVADSIAISLGGATFYRNRTNTYKKQGLTQKEAEAKAFSEFREISEETQQSARPDKISMEQAGLAGRFILNFQNTPMQYNRLAKRAIQDLVNRRGDPKTNVSKIIYYLGVQNALFYSLQQGLFAVLFDDDDEEEQTMADKERYFNAANGMADSVLRGSGIFGAIASTAKNVLIELIEQERRDDPDVVLERKKKGLKKQQRDWIDVVEKITAVSPPVNSKFRKLTKQEYLYESNKERKRIKEMGLDSRNPAVVGAADVVSVAFNLPTDRILRKVENVRTALGEETEAWQSVALMFGWSKWELNIQDDKKPKPEVNWSPKINKRKLSWD